MAFFGNFEGTMKSTILIGKNGIKLSSVSNNLKIQNSSSELTRVKIADAVDLDDAVTLSQLNNVSTILGSAASEDVSYFATAAQGATADTALQPNDNISLLINDSGYALKSQSDIDYATAAQGATADTALQPNDNISLLINDSGYLIKSGTDLLYSPLGHTHALLETATFTNTISTLVLRDASGNFSASTITANLIGNSSTASKLETSRTVLLQGDINATIAFDGSQDLVINSVFSASGVVSGTYNNSSTSITPITVDEKGRITSTGTEVTITPDWSSITSTPSTLSGYGITDAVSSALIGVADGIATLDSSGKLTTSQMPSSLVGAVVYQGVWDASTNTPTLESSVGTKGWYYKVSVAGSTVIDGITDWRINDVIIFDGSTWDKLDGAAGEVLSVNSKTGDVVLSTDDVSEGSTNLYYTDVRASAAAPVQTVQNRTGDVVITALDVGLDSVDNVKQLPYTQEFQIIGDLTSVSTALNLGQLSVTLAQTGVVSGTYNNSSTSITPITVDEKGRITSTGTEVTITPDWSSITSTPSTLSGYGITDAQGLNDNLTTISSLSNASTGLVKLTNGVASLDTNTYLTGNQTITVSGDGSGTGTTAITLTLASTGVVSGTYNNSSTSITPITVDEKGRITSTGTEVTITPDWSSITSTPSTLSGYGITDALQALSDILTSISALDTQSTGFIQLANGVASLQEASTGGGNVSTVASGCVYENSQTITADYTVTTGMNAMSAGPITISDGVVVTIPDGSAWAIV